MTGEISPNVTFVIPTYNRVEALRSTLASIAGIDHPRSALEVIVVNDGGAVDPSAVVEERRGDLPRVRLVHQANAGAAAARNRGASEASGELLIFLDDDMLVEPDHVALHMEAQRRYGPCLVNGRWRFAGGVLEHLRSSPFGRYREVLEEWMMGIDHVVPLDDFAGTPPGVTAANLGVPTSLFRRLGGFDDSFPHAGYEDHDLSLRAAAEGIPFVHVYELRLWHNDQRLTFVQFCRRQEQGARTAVHLAAKDPRWGATRELIVVNLSLRADDGFRLGLRKTLRFALARPSFLSAAHGVVRLGERVGAPDRAIRRAYWAVIGLHMTRGVRDGIAAMPGVDAAVRGALAADGAQRRAVGTSGHRRGSTTSDGRFKPPT